MKLEKTRFPARRSRAIYVAERFRKYLHGDVLDVGCEEEYLKTLLPHINFTGIDIVDRLPFADHHFDCVLCSDVLEHFDNLHQIFLELLRVSRRYVIISLPNNSSSPRLSLGKERGYFYGLPIVPNLCDIVDFMEEHAKKLSFDIVEMFATDKPHSLLSQMLKRINSPSNKTTHSHNSNTLWTIIEKR